MKQNAHYHCRAQSWGSGYNAFFFWVSNMSYSAWWLPGGLLGISVRISETSRSGCRLRLLLTCRPVPLLGALSPRWKHAPSSKDDFTLLSAYLRAAHPANLNTVTLVMISIEKEGEKRKVSPLAAPLRRLDAQSANAEKSQRIYRVHVRLAVRFASGLSFTRTGHGNHGM